MLLSVRVGVSIGQGQCCYQAGTVEVSVAVSQDQGCCQSGSLLAFVKVSAIVSQQQGWNKSWSVLSVRTTVYISCHGTVESTVHKHVLDEINF